MKIFQITINSFVKEYIVKALTFAKKKTFNFATRYTFYYIL